MVFRYLLLGLFFHIYLVAALSAQELKFITPTLHKTYEGAAPIASLKYEVFFKKKKNQALVVDSIKSVEDEKMLPFSISKKINNQTYRKYTVNKIPPEEKGNFRLNFDVIIMLSDEPSPAYSEENKPIQYNMSRGVCIYYTLSGKSKTSLIKNFKEISSTSMP